MTMMMIETRIICTLEPEIHGFKNGELHQWFISRCQNCFIASSLHFIVLHFILMTFARIKKNIDVN